MELYCGTCQRMFWQTTGRPAVHCASCRSQTSERYGRQHRKLRENWAEIIRERGAVCTAPVCLEKTRLIEPGGAFDLGHADDGTERGPEHPFVMSRLARSSVVRYVTGTRRRSLRGHLPAGGRQRTWT